MTDLDKTRPSSRARIAGSEGGDVPEKYYVVQNNDMVRVKYLLVYTSKDLPRRLLVFLVLSLFVCIVPYRSCCLLSDRMIYEDFLHPCSVSVREGTPGNTV